MTGYPCVAIVTVPSVPGMVICLRSGLNSNRSILSGRTPTTVSHDVRVVFLRYAL